jgi:20S proteasome subunit alpha 3
MIVLQLLFIFLGFLSLIASTSISSNDYYTAYKYSEHCATFNPNGNLLHLEYAKVAVEKRGSLLAGIKTNDGIVILTSKKKPFSKLTKRSLVPNVVLLNSRLLVASTGLSVYSQNVQDICQDVVEDYNNKYFSRDIPIEYFCNELSKILHSFTVKSDNPRAVKLLVAGYDEVLGYQLYSMEPEGAYYGWKAIAIGGGHDKEKKINSKLMELLEKVKTDEENDAPTVSLPTLDNAVQFLQENIIAGKVEEDLLPKSAATIEKDDDSDKLHDYQVRLSNCASLLVMIVFSDLCHL